MARTLQLAESLGAKTISLPGRSVAETIVAFARSRNISRIVAGKPLRPRWLELIRGSVVDQIIRRSGEIDVYVISGTPDRTGRPAWPALPLKQSYHWSHYLQSLGLVALTTLIGLPLRRFIEPTNLVMLYLLAVVIAALGLGRRPAILASVLSVLAFDVIFVPPFYTLAVSDAESRLSGNPPRSQSDSTRFRPTSPASRGASSR